MSSGKLHEFRFPGALSLTEDLDNLILAITHDGRHVVGRLSSLDQYTNLVIEDAAEWIIHKNLLAVQPVGLYLLRSDNILLVGSFDENKLASVKLRRVELSELLEARANDPYDTEEKKWKAF